MKYKPSEVVYRGAAAQLLRSCECQAIAEDVLSQLPATYPGEGVRLEVTVFAKPRSRGDNIETLVDYIESGGRPPIGYVRGVLEDNGFYLD